MRFVIVIAAGMSFGVNAEMLGDDEFLVKPNEVRQVQAVPNPEQTGPRPSDIGGKKRSTAKPRKCFRCNGAGSVIISTHEKCSRCDGTGVLVTDIVLKDTIHKTGVQAFYNDRGEHWSVPYGYNERGQRVSKNRQPCPQCKRRGSVSVKKSVECTGCKGAGWLLKGKPFWGDHDDLE